MTVSQAFNILGLSPDASKETMIKRYRTLIQHFHPDKVSDSIAGNRDAKILNQAYSLLLEYFDRQAAQSSAETDDAYRSYQSEHRSTDTDNNIDGVTNDSTDSTTEVLLVPASLRNNILSICGFICDYYVMSMANIPLRASGSTNTFFSSFIHKYQKALTQLSANQHDTVQINQLLVFFNCFYHNARLNFFLQPTRSRKINQLYRAYIQSSSIIDDAIAIRYCDNHTPLTHTQYISNKQLYDTYQVLRLLSSSSNQSVFNKPAQVKIELLDSFVKSMHWAFEV